MPGPLAGIKVLEIANWVAVPGLAALFADMGADVIKLEPPRGDAMRGAVRRPAVDDARRDLDVAFQMDNRGKRSIAVDLESEAGREVARRLLADVDVFATNLVPDRMRRYGLDPESVHRVAPRVVHVSLTAFGHRGEEADRTGFDHMAFFARSGATDLVMGDQGGLPQWGTGQGDHTTTLNLLASTLVGLRMRDQTGRGQVVRTSLLQTGVYTLASDYSSALVDGRQPPRTALEDRPNVLYRPWLCKDERWVMLMMLNPKPYWPGFCQAVGHPEWAEDPRFARFAGRVEHRTVLNPMIEKILASRTLAEWGERFDAHGLMWAPVQRVEDGLSDPQMRANGLFSELEHPTLGRFETVSAPFHVEGAEIAARGPAPEVGEHTGEILAGVGFDPAEIEALRAVGTVGHQPRKRR